MIARRTFAAVAALLIGAGAARAQESGAAAFARAVADLGVTARVLVIAAHPDDEDTRLITLLARGRGVETAYLSLTRGDGGQNLIGGELGEALGVVRTEELLTARRIDGAKQFFTRAYDFGFSKSADETYRHWPREELLHDALTVVRAFKPHVIVSVFSGTPADGHGQHQVSGLIARDVYDAAPDTVKHPAARTGGYGAWTPLKFYRSANFRGTPTHRYNAGEFDPLYGRSYAEIAAESRSQHKSQAFGVLQRKGVSIGALRREHTRASAPEDPLAERSPFDGIDTTWTRLRPQLRTAAGRALLDSVIVSVNEARTRVNLLRPDESAGRLTRVVKHLDALHAAERPVGDVASSLRTGRARAERALLMALGVAVEASAARELLARGGRSGDTMRVTVTVYNRGRTPLRVAKIAGGSTSTDAGWPRADTSAILPDSARAYTGVIRGERRTSPYWLERERQGDLFAARPDGAPEDERAALAEVPVTLAVEGVTLVTRAPVVYRFADPVRGDVSRPIAVVPVISLTLDREIEYAPAGAALNRELRVTVRSAADTVRAVRVSLRLPSGLTADSAARTLTLPAGASRTIAFRVRGRLAAGRHVLRASAESEGETFSDGWTLVDYPHIRPQRMYRPATLALQAIDVKVPATLAVGYITGAGDNIAPILEQLGVRLTLLDPAKLPVTNLSRYDAIVVGTRAYESSAELVENNARLLDYAHGGGTLIVQYGQFEMQRPGMMPYPITLHRPADRVSVEDAPVTILQPDAPLLSTPNRITAADFAGWVQDRSLYMPRTFDEHYTPLLEMSDPGENPNRGALLVARYGKGTYVYTTLAFFRQLPAGVPGAARLFVNLMASGEGSGRPGETP